MNDIFKKFCACGGLAVVIYGSTPRCKNCFLEKHFDLPIKSGPTTTSISTFTISVSGATSSTTTTTQPPYNV